MTTLLEDPTFVFMWISFLMLMSVGTAVFFLWAIRAEQFSKQDQARYLALQTPTDAGTGSEQLEPCQSSPFPPALSAGAVSVQDVAVGKAAPAGDEAATLPYGAGDGAPRASEKAPLSAGSRGLSEAPGSKP